MVCVLERLIEVYNIEYGKYESVHVRKAINSDV